jgi:putative copper export protein
MLVEWVVVVSLIGLAGGLLLPEWLARSSKTTALMAAARRRQHLWLLVCAVFSVAATAFASLNVLAEGLGGRDAAFALARVVFSAAIALVVWDRLDASRLALPLVLMLLLAHSLLSRSAGLDEWVAHVLVDWFHLSLTAAWLGGVAILAAVFIPAAISDRSLTEPLSAAVDRFSPLAMFCVLGLGVSGLIQGSAFVGGIEQLATTPYGQALLVKLALAAALVAFGAFHQQFIAPKLRLWRLKAAQAGAERAALQFQLSLWAEVGVGLLLLAAVGMMKALPAP